MAKIGALSLVILLTLSCKMKRDFAFPFSDYVILKHKTEWYWIFKDVTPSNLSNKELVQVEEILQSAIVKHNNHYVNDSDGFNKWGLELKNYKRQYVPVINQNGEKVIWINFFCQDFKHSDWRKEILIVDDGGNCYFNIKINLTTKKYSDLQINGNA